MTRWKWFESREKNMDEKEGVDRNKYPKLGFNAKNRITICFAYEDHTHCGHCIVHRDWNPFELRIKKERKKQLLIRKKTTAD